MKGMDIVAISDGERFWRKFIKSKVGIIGLVLITLIGFITIFGPIISHIVLGKQM